MTDANLIAEQLRHKIKVTVLEETDSTNNEMKRRLQTGSETLPQILLACRQTAGRGRMGRSFFSPKGGGMYLTVAMPIPAFSQYSLLTAAAGAAVYLAVEKLTGRRAHIKWVNDVYLDGKKICGILAESVADTQSKITGVIVGIGVNTSAEFPEDLRQKAGVVDCDENRLAACITDILLDFASGDPDAFLAVYNDRLNIRDKEIFFRSGDSVRRGVAAGVRKEGCLEVLADDGETVKLYGSDSIVREG